MFRPGPPHDRRELPPRFGFLDVEVDREAARATRAGRTLPLEPKAFDLLLLLAANPGRVVEKQEIFDRLWTDAVVTDNALARVVAQLRRELGDSAEEGRVIETVRTRGYRFLPELWGPQPQPPGAEPAATPASPLGPVARPRRPVGRRAVTLGAALALGLAAAGLWLALRSAPPEWVPTPVQRSIEAGYRGGADLSPDGSQMVYSSDAAGGLELFVRQVEGGPELQITRGGGPKIDPVWSPDGRLIAYYDLAAGGLWLVAPTGGAPRQITDSGSQPAWFPDSRRLVFSDPGRPTIGAYEWPATYNSTLWTVDLDGSSPRPLTVRDPEAGGQGAPAVSADGRWVYFSTGRLRGGGALWRIAATGGTPQRLMEPVAAAEGSDLQFWLDPRPESDGDSLLAIETGRTRRIVRVGLTGARHVETLLAQVPAGVSHLALSRDGRRLVYTEERGRTSLEEVEVGVDGRAAGPPRVLSAPATLRVLTPRYSPDGARIRFQRRRPGLAPEVVIFERATGATRVIEVEGARTAHWLDATRLVLGWPGRGIELDLATGRRQAAPAWKAAADLLSRGQPRPLALFADARRVLFTALTASGAQELFFGDLESGASRQLTRLGRSIDYPFVSHDGRWIGFQVASGSGSDNELWRMAAGGGEPERLLTGAGPSWGGAFAPGGDRMIYAAHREGSWYLATAGVADAERRLDLPPETAGYLRWTDWSPDGRQVVYERMRHEASIWTLDLPPSR